MSKNPSHPIIRSSCTNLGRSVSSIPEDPTGDSVEEVAYFDIYPEDDEVEGGGEVEFTGTWSHYPYFKSGYIVINTIERGAYVVKRSEA